MRAAAAAADAARVRSQARILQRLRDAIAVEKDIAFRNSPVRAQLRARRAPCCHAHVGVACVACAQSVHTDGFRLSAYLESQLLALGARPAPWLPKELSAMHVDFQLRYAKLPPAGRYDVLQEADALLLHALAGIRASASQRRDGAPPSGGGRVLHSTGGQRTQAWFERRERMLTASTFGNVLGVSGEARFFEPWVRPAGAVRLYASLPRLTRLAARRSNAWAWPSRSRATSTRSGGRTWSPRRWRRTSC